VTTTKNRFLYLAAAAALGLTLASCSGDAGADDTADSGAEGEQTTSEQTEESGDEAADDDGGDAGAPTGPECLVGTWEMTPEAMEEQVLAQLGGEGEVSVEGTSTMSFDGTTVTTDVDNSSTTSIEVEGTTVESATTTDGTVVINYTADEQTITYTDVVSAEGTVSVQIGDTSQEADFAETAGQMADQSVTYTCTDDELTITTEMASVSFSQTLTRA
jgi:membrane-bound inhibitor of C-type lysozyme